MPMSPEALRWSVRRLPYTPWQTNTCAGSISGIAHPGIRVPNRARIDTGTGRLPIDVRGDGGFVDRPGFRARVPGPRYLEARRLDPPHGASCRDSGLAGSSAHAEPESRAQTADRDGDRDLCRPRSPLSRRPSRTRHRTGQRRRRRSTPRAVWCVASRCPRRTRKRCCGTGPVVARAGRVSGSPARWRMRSGTGPSRSGRSDERRRRVDRR